MAGYSEFGTIPGELQENSTAFCENCSQSASGAKGIAVFLWVFLLLNSRIRLGEI